MKRPQLSALRNALWRVPVGLQLSALYTLLLVLILTLLGWALYAQLDRFLVRNQAERLDLAAQSIDMRNGAYDRGGRRPNAQAATVEEKAAAFLVSELSGPDITVAVMDTSGAVITSTQSYDPENPRRLPELPAGWVTSAANSDASGVDDLPQWVLPGPAGGRQLVVVERVNVVSGPAGPRTVQLLLLQAASLDAADALLNQLRLYLLLGVIIGTVIGVLAGLGLTRAVLNPLDNMARTAEAISGGDLNRRLRLPARGNEITRLGGAFDHMVDRLAATLAAQRRFIADASHELRTPLTSLEGLSEMLLIGADRGNPAAQQRALRSMHGELGRMGRLVSDLLTLSRLDSAAPMLFAPLDAGSLLEEVALQEAPLAEARQIRLTVQHDGPVALKADPDRLKQVLLNLVDNALRYTPPDGEVSLAAEYTEGGLMVRLTVRDTGPGITSDDLPHLFDRFYRGDPSRARASGNTGLGLAIARGIVEAHGGTIAVQSLPGAGATFIVLLPTERPGDHPVPATTKRERHASITQP